MLLSLYSDNGKYHMFQSLRLCIDFGSEFNFLAECWVRIRTLGANWSTGGHTVGCSMCQKEVAEEQQMDVVFIPPHGSKKKNIIVYVANMLLCCQLSAKKNRVTMNLESLKLYSVFSIENTKNGKNSATLLLAYGLQFAPT